MKHTIERVLFWFMDGNEQKRILDERYFALGNLLTRLLRQKYQGKRIEFININFNTEKTYELHPLSPKFNTHFYGGHLTYDDVFDLNSFNKMSEKGQNEFIWKRAFQIFQEAATFIKNESLLSASEYAYHKGLEINLNPDYRMVEKDIVFSNQKMKAAVWVNFRKNGMYSTFTLEKDGEVVFKKEIDKTKNGIEFFLEIYKSIDLQNDSIIIKGHKDVEYFPLKIPLEEIQINI